MAADSGSNTVLELLGNGDGTFQGPAAVNPSAGCILVSQPLDFNGDGKLDLAVSRDSSTNISVFWAMVMVLSAPANYAVGSSPGVIAVGDFNGDGKPDLAVANGGDYLPTMERSQFCWAMATAPSSPPEIRARSPPHQSRWLSDNATADWSGGTNPRNVLAGWKAPSPLPNRIAIFPLVGR